MKRTIAALILALFVVGSLTMSFFVGWKRGHRQAELAQLVAHAQHIVCELEYLRQTGYADTNHLNYMEANVDLLLVHICGSSFRKMPFTEQERLRYIKRYRSENPFVWSTNQVFGLPVDRVCRVKPNEFLKTCE